MTTVSAIANMALGAGLFGLVLFALCLTAPCVVRHQWGRWCDQKVIEQTTHVVVNAWTGAITKHGPYDRTEFWQRRECERCGKAVRIKQEPTR